MNSHAHAHVSSQYLTGQPSARPLSRLLQTQDTWGPLALRLGLAAVMFPHGAQKLLGWWGGYGYSGTLGFLTDTIGLPTVMAAGLILIEFFAPVLLALGLGTRLAAAGLAAIMVGAIATVHAQHGFFMNWSGTQAGEGFEYHLLVLSMAVALFVAGSGRASIDRWLAQR